MMAATDSLSVPCLPEVVSLTEVDNIRVEDPYPLCSQSSRWKDAATTGMYCKTQNSKLIGQHEARELRYLGTYSGRPWLGVINTDRKSFLSDML